MPARSEVPAIWHLHITLAKWRIGCNIRRSVSFSWGNFFKLKTVEKMTWKLQCILEGCLFAKSGKKIRPNSGTSEAVLWAANDYKLPTIQQRPMPGDELLNSGEQTSEDEAVFPLGTSSSPLQTSAVQTNQVWWYMNLDLILFAVGVWL